jgi:uncharacterized protein (DUF1015 family)
VPEIEPFRGIHYDPRRVGSLSRVMTQPYDRIDAKLQDAYYRRHPHNFIRVDKRRDDPYAGAAKELASWLDAGVLVRDPAPALYVYHQAYRTPSGERKTRRGVSAMVRLEEPGKGRIHPHEETHAGPKIDRRHLLEATRTHLSHVFLLYSDARNRVNALLDPFAKRRPLLEAKDDCGETHRVWRVDDPRVIAAVQRALRAKDAIIADGHHRYETAWGYRQDHPEATHVLATLINMDDEGLTIFGTHRVIRGFPSWDFAKVLGALPPFVGVWSDDARRDYAREMIADPSVFPRSAVFGAVAQGNAGGYVLRVTDPRKAAAAIQAPKSVDWRSLDVNILHHVILDGIVGITPEDTRHERYVTYHRSADEAVGLVASGRAQGAFLLRPVRIAQIRKVVAHGERFPQKTTDFYPKLLSGLVMAMI